MDMPKKILYVCTCIFCGFICAQPTHVFVKNCTPLQFDVSIEYKGIAESQNTIALQEEKQTITPFAVPEEKNMILAIPRELPAGEHIYTIKLTSELETISLKQKCISQSPYIESELGLSLESICLSDPWFMNNQAKQRHEHFLYINKHIIVIVYYSYDTKTGEDVDYILYEKIDPSFQQPYPSSPCKKIAKSSFAIPIFSSKIKKLNPLFPLSYIPGSLQGLQKRTLLTENKYKYTSQTSSQSVVEQSEASLSLLYNFKNIQSLNLLKDQEETLATNMHAPLLIAHTQYSEYSEQESLSIPLETQKVCM